LFDLIKQQLRRKQKGLPLIKMRQAFLFSTVLLPPPSGVCIRVVLDVAIFLAKVTGIIVIHIWVSGWLLGTSVGLFVMLDSRLPLSQRSGRIPTRAVVFVRVTTLYAAILYVGVSGIGARATGSERDRKGQRQSCHQRQHGNARSFTDSFHGY
jgi:hypothetical protein